MASKDVIQINKLKIGSSGITGLYVGNTESKYAVMTDSAKTQTVIYDKVNYNFVVNDYSDTVPASGATLNITGTSTKTHGNGAVEQVGFSPTSVTVPANTGSSYSSSVTVTQGTSNLTDAYNYTVAGDAVKSISLTISNPATIPAAGGSVNTCTTAATVTYNSGRQVTSFTPTSVNFNTVSAGTKGTTVSDVTTAGTLTCYIVFGGVTSNTASVYVKQAANAVVSYTGYSDLAGKTISASKVPASGGTSTISWSGTPSAKRKPVYTSTATGSSVSYTPSISTAVTGNSAVASKGSTISNETTAIATVTGYYWADGLTASTTTSVKQNGNYVTKVEASGYTAPSHFSYSNIGAGATSATPNYHGGSYYTFTSGSRIYDSNNSPSFGGTATYTRSNYTLAASQNGFTAVNSSNGTLTATSLGTTISNARTSANVSAQLVVTYTHASSYSAGGTVTSAAYTSTATCTQNGNYVTSISVSSVGLAYDAIPASGGSKTPTGSNGTVTYTFSSTSTSTTAPSSTYGSLTTTPSYAMTASGRFTLKSTSTGEVSATTKGTSVEGITSSDTITKTVNCTWTPTASYNAAGTKTASGTATGKATQAANAVTGYVDYQNPTGKSISGSQVPASGGTSTITWAGTCKQQAKAVYTSNSTASSYTELTISSPSTTVTGNNAVSSKGTTVSNVTTAQTVTGYYWANGKTASTSCYVTQAANAVTNTAYGNVTITSPSNNASLGEIAASGGSKVPTRTATQTITYTFTSTSTSSSTKTTGYSWTTDKAAGASLGSGFYCVNDGSSIPCAISAETRGTTAGDARTSNSLTLTCTGEGSKSASVTYYATQAKNEIVSYTDYGTPTGKSISGSQVPAAGGTSTITWSGTPAQTRKPVYTSTATGSSVSFTPTISTAVTGNSAVSSKGTTISNVTTAITTVTGYYWANGKTASTTCSVTQAANQVVSYTDYQTPTGKSISGSQVPAAGGTSTITWSGTAAQNAKAVYTSTATASTYTNVAPSVSTAITGNNAVSSKGTTVSNVTTAQTVTGYYWANGKTASTTCYVTQAANAVTSYTDYQTPTGKSISGSQVPAAGGTSTISWSGTAAQNAKAVYTSNATASTYTNVSPSVSTAVTGNSAVGSKGTTVSNVTTALTVTGYYWANGKTASTSCYVTQAANAVVSYTDYQTPTGKSLLYSRIPASGGTSTISFIGTAAQNAKPVYTSTSTGSSYVNVSPSVSTAITGNSAVASKGTTISNETTALTATGYYWANGKTASTSCYVTQDGNYVTSIGVATAATVSYSPSTISAAGGTSSPMSSYGTFKFIYSSGSSSTTDPSSTTYGSTLRRMKYTMNNGNGFTIENTGKVTAESRGTTVGSVRTSYTITLSIDIQWTPYSPYTAGGSPTAQTTATTTVSQEANAVTGSGLTNITVSVPSGNLGQIAASGGKKTSSTSASGGVAWTGYTSSASATTQQSYTWAYNKSNGASLGNTFYFINNSTDGLGISATTKGTTQSNATTSNEVTVYAYVNNVNGQSKTGSTTFYATQAANSEGTTEYNAGNSGYTATVTIGNGMTAAGGSATVTYGASHIHYYRHQYSSGSYTGWYTPTVTDSAKIEISSNGNNRFTMTTTTGTSASNTITLSHSNMTTNAVTDNVTVKVTNLSNTSTTNTASKSIVNEITNSNYNAQSYWADISIGSGIVASGGSATVTASAGHQARNYYTSGSYSALGARTDSVTVTETVDNNNRYSYSNGTLTHSNMTTNETTDNCTLRATNASYTSTYKDTSVSVTNSKDEEVVSIGTKTYSLDVNDNNNPNPATGGSITVTANSSQTLTCRYHYTSGSYSSNYQRTVTNPVPASMIVDGEVWINPSFFTYDAYDKEYHDGDTAISMMGSVTGTNPRTFTWSNVGYYSAGEQITVELEAELTNGEYLYDEYYIDNSATATNWSNITVSYYIEKTQQRVENLYGEPVPTGPYALQAGYRRYGYNGWTPVLKFEAGQYYTATYKSGESTSYPLIKSIWGGHDDLEIDRSDVVFDTSKVKVRVGGTDYDITGDNTFVLGNGFRYSGWFANRTGQTYNNTYTYGQDVYMDEKIAVAYSYDSGTTTSVPASTSNTFQIVVTGYNGATASTSFYAYIPALNIRTDSSAITWNYNQQAAYRYFYMLNTGFTYYNCWIESTDGTGDASWISLGNVQKTTNATSLGFRINVKTVNTGYTRRAVAHITFDVSGVLNSPNYNSSQQHYHRDNFDLDLVWTGTQGDPTT